MLNPKTCDHRFTVKTVTARAAVVLMFWDKGVETLAVKLFTNTCPRFFLYNMDKDKKSEIHITNNFNAPIGQHIDHVDTINFRMDGDGNFHFGMVDSVSTAKTATEGKKRVDTKLLAKVLNKCEAFIWGKSAYGIVFCVCRDLYNLENNASNFERLLAETGIEIPDGTINAAVNRNPWMKLNIEKWEQHCAMQRALKLRDEFKRQMDLQGFVANQVEE